MSFQDFYTKIKHQETEKSIKNLGFTQSFWGEHQNTLIAGSYLKQILPKKKNLVKTGKRTLNRQML